MVTATSTRTFADDVREIDEFLEVLLRRLDPDAVPAGKALELWSAFDVVERRAAAAKLLLARRVEDGCGWKPAGFRSAAEQLAALSGTTVSTAKRDLETSKQVQTQRKTADALRAGRLSRSKAQMVAETAEKNPDAEEELLAAAELGLVPLRDAAIAARARVEDPDARTKRQHRERGLKMWTDPDGMVAGRFRLTPEVGGQVKAKVDAAVQRIFRAHKVEDHAPHEAYAADALAAFVLEENDGKQRRDPNATVHVVIDHGALMRGGAVDGEVCEIPGVGPVDVNWVRELLGSAFLTAIIKRGKDILTVAHLGRHIPAEIQTALLVSGHECQRKGCYQRGYLERDHTHDYAKGGPTSLENLKWYCGPDHRLKTSGWIVELPDPITGKCVFRPLPQTE